MPCHAIPDQTRPDQTIPYHAMPCHTIPYHTIHMYICPYISTCPSIRPLFQALHFSISRFSRRLGLKPASKLSTCPDAQEKWTNWNPLLKRNLDMYASVIAMLRLLRPEYMADGPGEIREPPRSEYFRWCFCSDFCPQMPSTKRSMCTISVIGSCSQRTFPMPSLALIPARLAVESTSSLSSKDVVEPPFVFKRNLAVKLDEDPTSTGVGFFNKDAWKFKKEMLRWKDMHKTSAFRDRIDDFTLIEQTRTFIYIWKKAVYLC